jgi:hypothetical protein
MRADATGMTVVGAAFLRAMRLADAAIHVEPGLWIRDVNSAGTRDELVVTD